MEQLSGAAHAGLDLVDNQQQAVRPSQRSQIAQELIGRRPHAGFALDRLQHDADGLVCDQPFDGGEIVQLCLGKARHLGLEQRLEGFLAGGRHGRQRPAVEAALEGDDLVGAVLVQGAVFAREFDRAFVGFRARIGEEHLIEAAVIGQRLCELEAGAVVKSRTRRQQQFCLCRQRFGDLGRGVAKAIDRPTLDEVEIALAAVVPQV